KLLRGELPDDYGYGEEDDEYGEYPGYEPDEFDPYDDSQDNPYRTVDPVFNNDINIHKKAFLINKEMQRIGKKSINEPPEYRFITFFKDSDPDIGVRMPFMRWYDTGVSAGNPYHGGSFTNTLGAFDTLIGVGREERDKVDGKMAAREAHN